MKSLAIMVVGLAIAAWGSTVMWNESSMAEGFDLAKPYYFTGGVIFLVGAVVNHWEHTRRKG